MVWYITRAEQIGGEQVARVALLNRKPGFGPPPPPITYEFRFLPGQTIIHRADRADIGEFAEHLTTTERMVHALRQGPMTVQELAELLDVSESTIRVTLHRKRKIFSRLGDGRVALAKVEGCDVAQ
jgi:excisionase family DNA binding protein